MFIGTAATVPYEESSDGEEMLESVRHPNRTRVQGPSRVLSLRGILINSGLRYLCDSVQSYN